MKFYRNLETKVYIENRRKDERIKRKGKVFKACIEK